MFIDFIWIAGVIYKVEWIWNIRKFYLFICTLFNDAFSVTQII
jgi:hypothetical protein